MASVSSLDQDMRNLRLSRYTPQAANQVRQWIESTLHESLPSGDLLEALKDGVALCRLANLLLQPTYGAIKFKASPMPFIQMENISHFLRACEMAPLNMPAHDRFLTVDLYEGKDPAQVLQCLGAFSRLANSIKPNNFPTTIGPKKAGGVVSPNATGGANGNAMGATWRQSASFGRSPSPTKMPAAVPSSGARAMSPSLTGGSNGSQMTDSGGMKSSGGPVSSWSKRSDEGNTAPAWNIHQYGYMGGASQGNQGISFGARRQITSQAPSVPSLAEKERLRKEKAAEEERLRQQAEEAEQRRRVEREAEEERAKVEEEQRWEDETRRLREEERTRMEEQKRQWAEQERKWKEEEDARRKEEAEFMQQKKLPPQKPRVQSSGVLRGQTLSQYQKEQAALANDREPEETTEQKRVRELEKQLEEARERERQYQAERQERIQQGTDRGSRPPTRQTDSPSDMSWTEDERDYMRQQWRTNQQGAPANTEQSSSQSRPLPKPDDSSRPLPQAGPEPAVEEDNNPPLSTRLQPPNAVSGFPRGETAPMSASSVPQVTRDSAPTSPPLGSSNRPLPAPDKDIRPFASSSLQSSQPRISSTREAGDTALEQSSLRDSRIASQARTIAGGRASKSLLEREMERERERQREWESNQTAMKDIKPDESQGTRPGESWDVNQYGYVGGDSMNKGSSAGSGIDFGGRRQILGPREMKR